MIASTANKILLLRLLAAALFLDLEEEPDLLELLPDELFDELLLSELLFAELFFVELLFFFTSAMTILPSQ